MMPAEFDLKPGDEVTYDVVFEIPAGLTGISFNYTEISTEGEHATFTIPLR
jgi:hypothetical protein